MACCCKINLDLVACLRLFEEEIRFSTCPKKNKKKLENEMDTLRRMQEDVNTIIDEQKRTQPGTECKVVVRSWLDAVNVIENEVNALLESLVQRSSCTCCWYPRDKYHLGKKVADLIDRVNSLVEERKSFDNDNLVQPNPDHPVHKNNLKKEMVKLKEMQEDVTKIIKQQERKQPGTECKVVVKRWLDKVNRIDEEVNVLLESPRDNYHLRKKVADLIDHVNSLVEERKSFDDDKLVHPIPHDPIHNIPILSTPMVGRDGTSSEIHGYLRDSQVTTIGIWGMGGIGKTTMLKSIKHGLPGKHDFYYIVWIEISQNVDILDTQKQIAKCISLSLPPSQDEVERARMLANALRSKKSLVLIDNVWEKLEFERIGIPFAVGTDLVKIVFTTRSEKVCNDMKAQKIEKLVSLDEAESLQLFQENISSVVDLTNLIVRQRIDEILKICGGLPLAILTVARTVANYTKVEEWDDAVDSLRSSRSEFEGMDDVMKCLKFSYDKLEDNQIRSCLLYFSLYPEGKEIETDELIKEWLAEGFLDIPNNNSFRRSYNRGVVKINKLKSICLVESGFSGDRVKVHDVVRDMIVGIREHDNKEVFLVYNRWDERTRHVGKISDSNYDRWDLAKGIYLNELQVKSLPEKGMPSCLNLTSLKVEGTYSNHIKLPTEDFFHFTPSLRVLDLSYTGLMLIPKSIGELVELRYLNLSCARIRTLPMELGNLKKLKCLDLRRTSELKTVVGSAISQLCMLQSLNMFRTGYQWNSEVNMTTRPPLLKLEDLTELKNLEDLGVDVRSNSHLNTISGNQILLNSIARISFIRIDFTKELQLIKWITERFPRLMHLKVDECALPDILEIKDNPLPLVTELELQGLKISSVLINDGCRPFRSLKLLNISGCHRLKEVSWTAHIPSLERLFVDNCNRVKELITSVEEEIEERDCYFPNLYNLDIGRLKNLRRIHGGNRPLLFPALRSLSIGNCPKLKQLSFGHDSAKNMKFIRCKQRQWDSLDWENDQIQTRFLPFVLYETELLWSERLGLLDEAESLQLFQESISSVVDLTDGIVRQRIDDILKICGGLPLVILSVARTVASYTKVEEWDDAVDSLRSLCAEFEGMDDVMKCLKFSYDKLEDNEIRSCLLYLSLYPEDSHINTDKLIKEWLGEGFLDIPNNNSFWTSYNRGVVFINKLKSICLVESVISDDRVKVQDVIGDVIKHDNKEVFLVPNDDDDDNYNYDHWDSAKTIHLTESQVKSLPEKGMPSCPSLTTLILQAEYPPFQIDKLPTEDFFHFTPSLRVLDLSKTGLVDIPKSIGELVELRYLDLSWTRIRTLPMELGNLKKLKCLDLRGTFELKTVFGSVISQLSMLQSLNLMNTGYDQWNSEVNMTTQPPLLNLEDLNELKNLEDLGVDVRSNSHLNTISGNQILLKSILRICFIRMDVTKEELQLIKLISERFPELMELMVDQCALPDILEMKDNHLPLVTQLSLRSLEISSVIMNDGCRPFRSLKLLEISGCQRLKEVSWTAHIPSLERLCVVNCNRVDELVEEEIEERDCYFPNLYRLEIKGLKNLRRIHGRSRPLLFPALRRLFIENCPKLKQLSFGHDSAKNMESIKCEWYQWDSLEWENDQVQSRFLRYFRARLH